MKDMLEQISDTEDPSSRPAADSAASPSSLTNGKKSNLLSWLKMFRKSKSSSENLREAIEEYMGDIDDPEKEAIAQHEQILITNVLELRDMTVVDVMIPRADISALDINTSQEDLVKFLEDKSFSRFPVYEDTLDNIVGSLHIKDLLAQMMAQKDFNVKDLLREAPIVSPAMPVLDLMLQMRQTKKHMAMVVDEYGGIDGLVTFGDVLEAIVGEIDDEFDTEEENVLLEKTDGSIVADARVDIEDFEDKYGELLSEEERDDVDTLGGLVFSIAGRIPARGEVIRHDSGMVFEVLDADPRRINRLRIKNIPQKVAEG